MKPRDRRGAFWLEDVGRDIGHAFRTLASAPGLSTVVVLTLALGIGANTAIFTVVNSLLLRTLPIVEPERLVVLTAGDRVARELRTWPHAVLEQLQLRSDVFDGVAASSISQSLSVSSEGSESEPAEGLFVTGNFFNVLGVAPLIGRTFTTDDNARGGGRDGPVAVISASLWQRRFAGSPGVVGALIVIDRVPFTIVGVAPSAFLGTEVGRTFDVAIPIGTEPLLRGRDSMIDNRAYWLRIVLRLKREQSASAATAILRAMQPQIADAFLESPAVAREDFLKQPLVAESAAAGVSRLRYQYTQPLVALLALASLVLLIACASIANLLLVRAVHRRHELQVRLALGAPRARIARRLLTESVVLAGTGGILGIVVASWGSQALVSQLWTPLTRVALDLPVDWRVIAFVSAVSLLTVVLFGTAPAFRGMRLSPLEALRQHRSEDEHGARPSRGARMALPRRLLVWQVALSVILVIAAGLFVRTLASLNSRHLGFDHDQVLIVKVGAQRTGLEPAARPAFYERAREAARAVAGVAGAAFSMITPLNDFVFFGPDIRVSGPNAPPGAIAATRTYANMISPGWFDTMGTPLLAGRDFTDDDRLFSSLIRRMRRINPARFRVATRGTSREINRSIVLTLVRTHQPISRADLARLMEVRRGAVTLIVNDLLQEGLIFEGATGDAVRGRKPTFLYIDSRRRAIVAVDVRASQTFLTLTDVLGKPLTGVIRFPTERDPGACAAALAARITLLLADHPDVTACDGIGVVVPGMVERATMTILHAPTLGWRNVDLREPLAAATGLPVQIENSGRACALAQAWVMRDDLASAAGDLVFVSVSDGVGVGVMIHGELLRGRHNIAGEFGHVPLSLDGPRCSCGANGCWEAYVSNRATLARYFGRATEAAGPVRVDHKDFTIDDLIARARARDAKAAAALESTARYLGLGLASVINALDPARVYIGGEITLAWDLIEVTVRAALAERALTPAAAETDIRPVAATEYPRLQGAAALIAAPAFAAPVVA